MQLRFNEKTTLKGSFFTLIFEYLLRNNGIMNIKTKRRILKLMKKVIKSIVALTLASAVIACAVSCGKNKGTSGTTSPAGEVTPTDKNALEILNTVWASYSEDEQFPASGGDESHLNFEGPGEYSVENAEMLDSMLGLPTELASKIESAASLSHAMNANTFTCGAFQFKNASDADAAVAKIKSNILARHWICGFPDSLLIMRAPGNCVIAVWGIDEDTGIVKTFKNKVATSLSGAEVVVEEPIV